MCIRMCVCMCVWGGSGWGGHGIAMLAENSVESGSLNRVESFDQWLVTITSKSSLAQSSLPGFK